MAELYNARNRSDPGPLLVEPTVLAKIRIVLVETMQPRNIGSVARAMKVMGLTRLSLVRPVQFPHQEAQDLASGAHDLLDNAQVVQTLPEAIGSCVHVFGASARRRGFLMSEVTPEQCAQQAVSLGELGGEVAIVFGPETAGLENSDLMLCQTMLQIPANPAFASLNLAAAVQIVSYQLRMAAIAGNHYQPKHMPAKQDEFEYFFQHAISAAAQANYFHMKNRSKTETELRRVLYRMQASASELKMLRGLFAQFQYQMARRADDAANRQLQKNGEPLT
jgi:tRNA (cytidine32/uridine32-2'-O)-methyltransferase